MSDASHVVAAAAREVLRPLGLVQRGRSRVWLDDHGWWLVVVEFQPSSWSQGTYLNVGAMWLWTPKNHLSFDHGSRVEGFEPLLDEGSFATVVRGLAVRAADEVHRLRSLFVDVRAVARTLAPGLEGEGWACYHAAVAHALAGDTNSAKTGFRALSVPEPRDPSWLRELRVRAAELTDLCDRPAEFGRFIRAVVDRTRDALELPEWHGTDLG